MNLGITDEAWEEFDNKVYENLNEKFKDKPFQKKLKGHCEVVYGEAVRWFGIIEKPRKLVSFVDNGEESA